MKFISTREIRNQPGTFRESLRGDDVVLTMNGKPFALVVEIREDELEETAALLRRVRAQQAVSRMRRQALAEGADRLSEEEIEEEVRTARAERRARR